MEQAGNAEDSISGKEVRAIKDPRQETLINLREGKKTWLMEVALEG